MQDYKFKGDINGNNHVFGDNNHIVNINGSAQSLNFHKRCFPAYCLSVEQYERLKKEGKRFLPHYDSTFMVEIVEESTPYEFRCKIKLGKWISYTYSRGKRYLNKIHRSITILTDHEGGKTKLFTFNKKHFYEVVDYRADSEGTYFLYMKKLSKTP